MNMNGNFSDESLAVYSTLVAGGFSSNFSEQEFSYDFTRCVKPDGTAYGTDGKCRKGVESTFDPDGGITTGASGGVIGGKLFGAKAPVTLQQRKPAVPTKGKVEDGVDYTHLYDDITKAIKDSKKLLAHRNKKTVNNLMDQSIKLLQRERSLKEKTGGFDNAYTALYEPLEKALMKQHVAGGYYKDMALSLYNQIRQLPGRYFDNPARI